MESRLRVNAARHGKKIREMSPSYNEEYFLPPKQYYFRNHIRSVGRASSTEPSSKYILPHLKGNQTA